MNINELTKGELLYIFNRYYKFLKFYLNHNKTFIEYLKAYCEVESKKHIKEQKHCPVCNSEGIIHAGWDDETAICTNCGSHTETEIGDYYDEGFMDGRYCLQDWNKGKIINL